MAYTQDQITELEKAIASGTLSVRINDRLVTYRSISEMNEILSIMRRDVQSVKPTTRIYATASKGLS